MPIPFNNEAKEVNAGAMKRQCDVNTTAKDMRRIASPSAAQLRRSQTEEIAERHNF
jgi:hypothetical protein